MSLEIQNQIRQNAQEMQDYVADLNKWQKDVKKRDKKLQKGVLRGMAGQVQWLGCGGHWSCHLTARLVLCRCQTSEVGGE